MKTKIIAPDYKRIFRDIIEIKYPDKKKKCISLLSKKELSTLDIIQLNQEIFETKDKETLASNHALRSYHPKTIIEILDYQRKNNINDSQLAIHFSISRNSIRKWKKLFKNI